MLENLNLEQKEKIKGAIVCSIIGDIYGLKYEGIKPKHINKEKILEKTFFNMYSDDTEHLLIMLKNINNLDNLDEFNNLFMIDLRKWLLTLPYGIGKATLKSVIKSFFTKKSGVVSQGNGALMRLGILGLFLKEKEIDEIVKSNCILTHNSSESVITSVVLSKILNFLLNNEFNLIKLPPLESGGFLTE